jgi:hypothetical protein
VNDRDTDRAAADPAAEFGEVWDLLDTLPRGAASATLAATTVELAAVAGAGPAVRGGVRGGGWLAPALTVAAALLAGVVAGRVTAPDPDLRILENLPLVRHLDLLREAGSTTFLEEMQRRQYTFPLRIAIRQTAESREAEKRRFMDQVAALTAELAASGPDQLAARRRSVQDLPAEQRVELERAAEAFTGLSAAERRTLAAVARALADPARADLREAAAAWHQWLSVARPEDRPEIVARGTDKRLEWLDFYSTRPAGRDGERPPRGPELRPRWPRGDAVGPIPRDGPSVGPPRGPGLEPPRGDRPPFSPEPRPRPELPADTKETRAPPR